MKQSAAYPDICAYLLKVCERCQHGILDERGITCLFDVDSGLLPAVTCETIAQIIEILIRDICAGFGHSPGRITVALHHKGGDWILAVRDQGIRKLGRDLPAMENPDLTFLLRGLDASYHARLMQDGAMCAIGFTISLPADTAEDAVEDAPPVLDRPPRQRGILNHPL